LVIAAAACYALYYITTSIQLYRARQKIIKDNGCQPAVWFPLKDPFLGIDILRENVKFMKERRFCHESYLRFQRLGNTYRSKMFWRKLIVTREPENVKTILSINFKDYCLGKFRLPLMGPLLGEGIFTTDGDRWAHSRAMIRPNFVREQVADLPSFEKHLKLLFNQIPRDGSTFDLQDLFFKFTLDSATEFLFGTSTNSLSGNEDETTLESQFARSFCLVQESLAKRARFGELVWLFPEGEKVKEATKICHAFVDMYVEKALEYRKRVDIEKNPEEDKYVFLYELAKHTTDKLRLRSELLNVLLAGRDTTASLLSNMMFEISKQPAIWQKIREEVAPLNGQLPTYEQLRNFKFIKYCINESLRLHPVVPGNSRLATSDTILPLGGGPHGRSPLFVPAGTLVVYSPYSMHRRADFYGPDALVFRPARWEALRPGWEYLPFNGGPRICLGQQYALTEAGYVVARLAQEVERVEARGAGEWVEWLTLSVACWGGVRVG
ncbi:putative cytochrome P450 alkane hydroxylase, partial [Patellaria atrata CBS 101060]